MPYCEVIVPSYFTIHFDGACRPNPGKGGAGGKLAGSDGIAFFDLGEVNQPEDATVRVYGDSELVVDSMNGTRRVQNRRLKMYHAIARGVAGKFGQVSYTHIGRGSNTAADGLARRAIDKRVDPLIYRPSLAGASEITINGKSFNGTNGVMSWGCTSEFLIDLNFLLTIPGYGFDTLRNGLRAASDSKCVGATFTSNVLGSVEMPVQFSYSSPAYERFAKTLNVVVVDGLPVPFHVSDTHPAVEDCIRRNGRMGSKPTVDKFPEEYRQHPHHTSNVLFLPYNIE